MKESLGTTADAFGDSSTSAAVATKTAVPSASVAFITTVCGNKVAMDRKRGNMVAMDTKEGTRMRYELVVVVIGAYTV